MEWNNYWSAFITRKKLLAKIKAMDETDIVLGREPQTEKICRLIYNDYKEKYKNQLESVKDDFLKVLDGFNSVHLQSSRVKTIESLLEKIIAKRYSTLKDQKNEYANISVENYYQLQRKLDTYP